MSEPQDDLLPPNQEPIRYVPGQPLPRLWKTEPDPEDEDEEETDQATGQPARKKKKSQASKEKEAVTTRGGFFSKLTAPADKPATSKAAKPKPRKKKVPEGEPNGEKKVLLEETPVLDTIESRQRARMIVGGLMIFCLLILGWIVYGMIFPGSSDLGDDAGEMPVSAMNPLPGPALSREPEARYMLDRAREHAKAGKAEMAIAMLNRIVSVYRGTTAAAEAQAALDRPGQKLPLFPDRPYVLASKATGTGTPAVATTPPASASSGTGSPPAGSALTGPTTSPVPPNMPPPQVAQGGNSASPRPSTPPPGPGTNPGASTSAPPGPAANPGTTNTPRATSPAMGPNVAATAPPPGQPGTGAAPPPSAPAPGPGPGGNGGAPPPGPGEVAIVIPGPGGNSNAMPPAGGNPNNPLDAVGHRSTPTPGRTARTLPPGFKARAEAGYHESGWPMIIVGERDNALMALVPGGTFTMGSDAPDAHAGPAHTVQLSTYYIDQHEVTNRQFRNFLDSTRYHGQPPGKWLTDPKMRAMPDDAPAVYVSYQDAEEYAIWALKRLPTEAQWEMAARGADGRRSPWGDEPPRWSRPRKLQQVDRVMSFPEDVSPFGVFDLAGNTVEWVRDWYDPDYYSKLRDKLTTDPTGPPTKRHGIQRVVKGSSRDWLMFARQGVDTDRRLPYVGFRCSLAVEGGEASASITPHPPQPNANPPGSPPPAQGGGNDVPF